MNQVSRRHFIKLLGGSAAATGLVGFPMIGSAGQGKKIVIVGGGIGGATAAKYIKRADPGIDVTLIEANKHYYTCFMSNEVLSGERSLDSIKFGYDGLKKLGVNVIIDTVTKIDADKRKVTTQGGTTVGYDRAIVSPGVSFKYETIVGYSEKASQLMPHAWKAGEQTTILRKQLESMKNGGVVLIAAPPNPFRCPPGPYERACQIAHYLQQHKPKSKIMILDAKDKFSKQGLFKQGWAKHYKGLIEWVGAADTDGGVKEVDAKKGIVKTEFDTHKPAVANIIPAQKAGKIAHIAGLTNSSGWCPVDAKTFESTIHKNIHVIGDASIASPLPKSGYAANSEAKVCAQAVVDLLAGKAVSYPSWVNTCYSVIAPDDGISVAMVYKLSDDGKKILKVKGSGGLTPMDASPSDRQREVLYAHSWFNNITHDVFY